MNQQTAFPTIRRIPPQTEPLSSDVFIIEGQKRCYVFDAGASDTAFEAIRQLQKPVTFILSHFHRDHTGNMSRLEGEVLAGARTCKVIGRGIRVDAPLSVEDGLHLLIQPCISPHAPGCVILTVNDTLTFLGDLIFPHPGKGQGEITGMLRTLKSLKTASFVLSHGETFEPIPKKVLLEQLEAQRQSIEQK